MNGWHRLWVFFSILLAVLAGGAAFVFIDDVQPRITESTLAYLRDKKPVSSGFDPSRPFVEADTGRVIVPPEYKVAMNEAAEREARHEKIQIAGTLALVWFGICVTALAFGHGVAWVGRGFRKKNA